MTQRLLVISDRFLVDARDSERARDLTDRLALRQLPQAPEQTTGCAPREHELATVREPQCVAREDRELALLLARGDDRELGLPAFTSRGAGLRDRAEQTLGRGRRAQRCAELHQALIQIARCERGGQRGHQLARALPERALARRRFDVIDDAVDPCEHPRDVAVDERRPFRVRDRGDRARGVRTDAGDAAQLAGRSRQLASEPRRDRLGTLLQVARARVVAEPRPRGEHVVERSRRERAHGRKLRHPPLPVRDHGLDACLLQHDLADPDRVWIARPAPRQVSLDRRVMRHDLGAEVRRIHLPLLP
ncbi:hypothetical protein BH11MYX1_BH11MYX1_23840 [soil metagenome]